MRRENSEIDAQPGDILVFSRPHRWADYLIKLLTRSRYYHVGIYAGRGSVVEARPKGVLLDTIGERGSGLLVVAAPGNAGDSALRWAMTQLGAPFDNYDYLVMILEHVFIHLHINYTPRGRYSCTELVAKAFLQAGVNLFPGKEIDDLEPKDFAAVGTVKSFQANAKEH